MPSRVQSVDIEDLMNHNLIGFSHPGVDFELVKPGRSLTQIAVITLPDEAAGKVGLRIGQSGDPIRLNSEGQVLTLDGDDMTAGVYFVWLAVQGVDTAPSGVLEFAIGGPK